MSFAPALQAFERVRENRKRLLPPGTDCLRLAGGAGDGLPGVFVDDFAGHWLVSTNGADFPGWLRETRGWRSLHHKILRRDDRAAPVPIAGAPPEGAFEVTENGLRYEIDFTAGYSQGLFLDQRDNRMRLREWLKARNNAQVLNTFAYTCTFSVVAAATGAGAVSVDLSARYLEWGRRNFVRNGLDDGRQEFLCGDVFEWLRRFAKRGRRFDAAILDPPTFSRTKTGRVFRVENDYPALVELACACAAEGAWILCTTNQRALSAAAFRRLVERGAPPGARIVAHRMPSDFSGDQYLKTLVVELA